MKKEHSKDREMHSGRHAFSHSEATDRGIPPGDEAHEADTLADVHTMPPHAQHMMRAHTEHKHHHDGGILKHEK